MTRDDIIRMAREAGWQYADGDDGYNPLWRFADLVAAAEREAMIADGWRHCAQGQRTTQFCGQLEAAVAAEREECAKVCDSFYESWIGIHGRYEFLGEGAQECAYAIRARGQNV